MGFNLYRAESPAGPYTRLNESLIPGSTFSVKGKKYSYMDSSVTRGKLYYYRLEDINVRGKKTLHGPICVDWDGDGMPDDWEIVYGQRETDPLNPDTDGDGILDGEEPVKGAPAEPGEARTLTKGVQVVAADDSGITLELRTEAFEAETLEVEGVTYHRLRVPEYIHGLTGEMGWPELPKKGVLLDLPDEVSATLRVEETDSETLSDYRIYPAPENVVLEGSGLELVAEVFAMDEEAYSTDAVYPAEVTQLGQTYVFRGQQKLQLLFYPFAFNPVTGELTHYSRIRVRVDYVGAQERSLARALAIPSTTGGTSARAAAWSPPVQNPVYRIFVSDEGIYRLDRDWLETNGVDVASMVLSQVRLYNLGQEVPITVYDQDLDNAMDAGVDYIQFYGRPVDAQYAKYAKYNVYWLTDAGVPGGLRMSTIEGAPGAAQLADTHTATVHHEEDKEYVISMPGPDDLDRWFFSEFVYGTAITATPDPVPVDFTLTLPDVTGDRRGTLKILMWGLAETDHEVEVYVNGLYVNTFNWSGMAAYEATIDPVHLFSGLNAVTFMCISGSDPQDPDGVMVDWFEVTYPRGFTASSDTLKFTHGAGFQYEVPGFTTTDIAALDITSAGDSKEVINFVTSGTGPYTLEMEPQTGTGERTYLVAAVKTPVGLSEDVVSDLADSANGADYILITRRDLGWDGGGAPHPWLNNLVTQREGQGLRVKVVDVEDIYNEFGYGIVTPEAVKDFLSHAYENWTLPAPQYVLLVGDGTNDPKENFKKTYTDMDESVYTYIPTYLTFTEYMGETATDEWFVQISGEDAVPDMYIGRLPAASVAQAEVMVNKIINYEDAAILKTWEKNVLLVADNQTEDYEALFEMMSNEAAGSVPSGMNAPFMEYLSGYPVPGDLTNAIKDKINNDGSLIVNYSGHGSTQIWAMEQIFKNAHVATLTNSGKLPFFVGMTCLNGYFSDPEYFAWPSLAEVLMRADDKGAVAAFMSTGMTSPDGQYILDAALFDAMFKQDMRRLGQAISSAKQTLLANGEEWEELSETFLLFGDPAMQLKIPLPTAPTGFTAQVQGSNVTLSWQEAADCNGGAVSGYNVYRSTTPGRSYTKLNGGLITDSDFVDTPVGTGTFYYVVTSVDADGDESAPSQEMSITIGRAVATGAGGGGGGGGCFISSAAGPFPWN
jgi:hypothetical protein